MKAGGTAVTHGNDRVDVLPRSWSPHNCQRKLDPTTRHIPVQIVTLEEERQHGLAHGAFAYLVKEPTAEGLVAAFDRIRNFTAPRAKRLLIVEDNDIERLAASTGAEALVAILMAIGPSHHQGGPGQRR